jgi:hypothetical protein
VRGVVRGSAARLRRLRLRLPPARLLKPAVPVRATAPCRKLRWANSPAHRLCLETTSWEEGEEGGERSAKLRPYVEAQLRTLQQGRMETHSLQLSLADFRELSKAVRGLKEGMDVHFPPV